MTRLLLVALSTLFVFCGCQSAPTFGQSATAAPQSQNSGLLDSVVQGVSSLWGGAAAPVPVPESGPPPVTLAEVAGGLTALDTQLKSMETRLDAVQSRTSKIDRRSGQERLLVLGLLAVNGTVVLVMLLLPLLPWL